MAATTPQVRIGIYGTANPAPETSRGWGIWPTGYPAALTAAGAVTVQLPAGASQRALQDWLADVHGLVFAGVYVSQNVSTAPLAEEAALLQSCEARRLPVLAIDQGMLALNTFFGGSLYFDVAKEFPEALQHRHPPEQGVRHAINVERGTHLARMYGEGEIVVNSEHRRAICRLARGFRVSGRALDGVIEAIESERADWFVLAVQWQPASATASGLDIQLFRGLVDVSARRGLRFAKGKPAAPRRRQLAKVG
jgi:putative glutamine amidotransferase